MSKSDATYEFTDRFLTIFDSTTQVKAIFADLSKEFDRRSYAIFITQNIILYFGI